MSIDVLKSQAALGLGFEIPRLRTILNYAWVPWCDDVWPCLKDIEHRLAELGDRLSEFHYAQLKDVRDRLGDCHCLVIECLNISLTEGDGETRRRAVIRPREEALGAVRPLIDQLYNEMRVFAWQAVAGDARMEAL